MTSLPVMYYALFDFEHFKGQFMQNPYLYKIGMLSQCFSPKIFLSWLAYAMVHAVMIYFVCIVCLLQPLAD